MIPARPLLGGYDHIVVGAGSAGCAVTRRLVDAGARVLLIEAGEGVLSAPEIDNPSAWVPLGRGRFDWGYDYAPTPLVNNRVIGIPRGKVLGGSSAINAMMWYRGCAADYDAWVEAGAIGWSFAECLPYFKRCEDWEGGESALRGAGGPLRIERSPDPHPIARLMIEGAGALGIPVIDDPNGASNEGATLSNFNISGGKRWSSAKAYLAPVLDAPNLTILPVSLATGLIFERGRCVGVRHVIDEAPRETRATAGVTLALGAIDTPRLMMLSGLGDSLELRRLGIPVIADLAGVGRNLQDHPLLRACNFRSKRPLGPPRDNGGGAMINWRSSAAQPRPDIHAFPIQGRSAAPSVLERYDLSGDLFAFGVGLMRSKSVGYLRLVDANPRGALEIQPNFLAEPEDLEALILAVGAVMDLVETAPFKDWFDGFAAPEKRLDRAGTIDFIRAACSTFFHTAGTCAMGTGEGAVVDPRLQVRGVEGLTIADASVIPIIPACNTHAPVAMIAERAADFLLGRSA